MPSTFTIELNKLRFFAKHGVYEQEKILGNEFEVNISLEIEAPDETLTTIDDTINYAKVYQLVSEVFSQPKPLLEMVAMEMANAIRDNFQKVNSIHIQVIKLHPPIIGFSGSVSVSYNKSFI